MIPQVRWYAFYCKEGKTVREFDDEGKETVFSKTTVPKEGLCRLGLVIQQGEVNQDVYFEMASGRLWIRGIPLWLYVDLNGTQCEVTRKPVAYEPIQFKSGYVDIKMTKSVVSYPTMCRNYNIGWKAKMDVGGRMQMVKAILTVDAVTKEIGLLIEHHDIKEEK